jgi:hypothetical protein
MSFNIIHHTETYLSKERHVLHGFMKSLDVIGGSWAPLPQLAQHLHGITSESMITPQTSDMYIQIIQWIWLDMQRKTYVVKQTIQSVVSWKYMVCTVDSATARYSATTVLQSVIIIYDYDNDVTIMCYSCIAMLQCATGRDVFAEPLPVTAITRRVATNAVDLSNHVALLKLQSRSCHGHGHDTTPSHVTSVSML